MGWLKRIGLAVAALALGVIVAEGALRLLPRPAPPALGKKWFRTRRTWGNCYASDPTGYLPLTLHRSAAHRQALQRVILSGHSDDGTRQISVPELVKLAPYCLIYDDRRTQGFFKGRGQTMALVGDSFTFGEGLRPKDSLGYLLGQRFPRFNVLNEGMCGVNVGFVRRTVGNLVGPPNYLKKLIYFYNPNDAFGAEEIGNAWVAQVASERQVEEARRAEDPGIWDRLVELSALAQKVEWIAERHRRAARILREVSRAYDDPKYDEHRSRTTSELLLLNQEAVHAGAEVLLVIYPFLYKDAWGRYPLAGAHRWVLDRCAELGLRCIDGLGAFAGTYRMAKLQVNPSDAHPGPEANRIMVEYLAEEAADFFE